MSYLSLSKEVWTNLPIKVEFAGFTSDTATLACHGWQFALNEERGRCERQFWILMQHEANPGCRFFCKGLLPFGLHIFQRELAVTRDAKALFDGITITVVAAGTIGITQVPVMQFRGGFLPWKVDEPVVQHADRIDLMSINPFLTFNPAKELIVDPHDVNQLMDLIVNTQKTHQREIVKKEFFSLDDRRTCHLSLVS